MYAVQINANVDNGGKMLMKTVAKASLLALLCVNALAHVETHPFSVHDMVAMERLSQPAVSPDGKWIVYVNRAFDLNANKWTSNLWLVSTDGTMSRPLTTVKHKSDNSPVWSPDSNSVAFLSNRGESQQIWLIPLAGGEPHQLSNFQVDVSNFKWSPDGAKLAFTADVYPEAVSLEDTQKRDKDKEASHAKGMIFNHLMIRHWDEWFVGKRSHIFVVPVEKSHSHHAAWSLAGKPIDLMQGVNGDSPTKPFGGAEEFDWSPDGKEIAYTMQIGNDMAWNTDLNIYVVPVSGNKAQCISCENKATDKIPAYSPDGKTIAYLAMARGGFESDQLKIKLYDRKTGSIQTIADNWDCSVQSLSWTKDGKSLLVTAEEKARQKIFEVNVADSSVKERVADGHNDAVNVIASTHGVVYAKDSLMGPAEIWSADESGHQKQLTHVNAERLANAQRSVPEEFEFVGALGETVRGWILKPVGFKEGKKYPLAFLIHGGPQGAWDDSFSYRWNPQAYAGAGFGVVTINFHGSTGYGQQFTDSISGDWGGKPFEDLMKGLDHVLAHNKWIDEHRVAALGASYGGYMINWINGHTDRFKCLVNHDGVFDSVSMYYSTEELWFEEWEHKGTPWLSPELYAKVSPSNYVANWKTPTLVIQGAKDYRITDAQGFSTFTALQRRGVPSKLLYFPDENHWVLKPHNSILWHDTVIGWLHEWLK